MVKMMGYEEVTHTADWALRVWAPDLPGLLTEAARGMYALMGARSGPGPRARRTLSVEAEDAETLLVEFLSEVLFWVESEGLVFDQFTIHMEGEFTARVEAEGAPYASLNKEIKAVTYHNLQVRETRRGLEVEIVFDV